MLRLSEEGGTERLTVRVRASFDLYRAQRLAMRDAAEALAVGGAAESWRCSRAAMMVGWEGPER